ncbi:MAG: preprotein translocase subunit SecY [Oscillospiraceae bacterium]|jgi:preprotein translocase subunit SecY|nr:preprotein translocase subunit SecY [Oscillospiraceae bacterium]
MLTTLKNAWHVPELRKKILYTLLMLLIYRLAGVIPIVGVNTGAISSALESNGLLGFLGMMAGNQNLSNMTIMAMGIMPYINASIIMQLLTYAIPALERLQKEGGEEGRKKIAGITRYVTVAIGFIMAIGLVYGLGANVESNWYSPFVIGLSMAAGSALAMWIGERITENGIGNGISLLIFCGIVSNLFLWAVQGVRGLFTGMATTWWQILSVVIVALVMIVAITFVNRGERRISVQYAKKVVGRKMYGGQSTHIPLKVDSAGVLPVIFASSFTQFPGIIFSFFAGSGIALWWNNFQSGYWYQIIFALLILAFAYFYSSITFNPIEISRNLQQNGGIIPGTRQGRPTSDYLSRISHRIILFDGIFLALLAIIPSLVYRWIGVSMPFGGTSLLIAVSVALETIRGLESQLVMRNYKGFL